jgi:hypothetical protein
MPGHKKKKMKTKKVGTTKRKKMKRGRKSYGY